MENCDDEVEEDVLNAACALPLPLDDENERYLLDEQKEKRSSFEDYLVFDETTQICVACDIVLESPSYGPLCVNCHTFLYPDNTLLQQLVDEERVRRTETEQSSSSSRSMPLIRDDSVERIQRSLHRGSSSGINIVNKQTLERSESCSSDDPTRGELLGFAFLSIIDNEFDSEECLEEEFHSVIEDDLVEMMPTEILVKIFSYLDEVGLCKATQVCRRWMMLTNGMESWSVWFEKRWPLFRPVGVVSCWRTLYVRMIQSSTCVPCFEQGFLKRIPADDVPNSWRNKRLRSELKQLLVDPPQGIRACPVDDEYSNWQASIEGPPDSVYEDGIFYVHLELPRSYPMRPPLVRFLTRILHPNVNRHGNVGMDCLRHNWSLALTIPKILVSVQSLLTDPYCEVNMEPVVARMYREDRDLFDLLARDWTRKFAMNHFQIGLSPSDV